MWIETAPLQGISTLVNTDQVATLSVETEGEGFGVFARMNNGQQIPMAYLNDNDEAIRLLRIYATLLEATPYEEVLRQASGGGEAQLF